MTQPLHNPRANGADVNGAVRYADEATTPERQEWRAYLEAGMPDATYEKWYRISVRLGALDIAERSRKNLIQNRNAPRTGGSPAARAEYVDPEVGL